MKTEFHFDLWHLCCQTVSWDVKRTLFVLNRVLYYVCGNQGKKLCLVRSSETSRFWPQTRLRVVPHFSSGLVERAKRERAWKSPHARKGDTRRGERKMRDYRQSPSFWTNALLSQHKTLIGSSMEICQHLSKTCQRLSTVDIITFWKRKGDDFLLGFNFSRVQISRKGFYELFLMDLLDIRRCDVWTVHEWLPLSRFGISANSVIFKLREFSSDHLAPSLIYHLQWY